MKRLIVFLAAWASLATAQEAALDEAAVDPAEPVRRYTVELIVFAYTEDASVGSEIFVPDEPPPDEEPFFDDDGGADLRGSDDVPEYGDTIVADNEEAAEEDMSPSWVIVSHFADGISDGEQPAAGPVLTVPGDAYPIADNAFQLVLTPEEDLVLLDVAERFELLDAYETLMHFGWTQPAFPEDETPPIELRMFAEPPPGLAGTLTLYLSRYLHLVVDVALDAPAGFEEEVVDEDAFYSFGERRSGNDSVYVELPMPVRFRIQEDRIVKNGELRYFDHPKFGILAKVSRVEQPTPAEVGQDDADLTGLNVQ